jgi:hypothetical protein
MGKIWLKYKYAKRDCYIYVRHGNLPKVVISEDGQAGQGNDTGARRGVWPE